MFWFTEKTEKCVLCSKGIWLFGVQHANLLAEVNSRIKTRLLDELAPSLEQLGNQIYISNNKQLQIPVFANLLYTGDWAFHSDSKHFSFFQLRFLCLKKLELLSEKVTKELCCFMRVRVLQLLVVNYTERLAEHSSWLAEAPGGESWLRPVRTRMEIRPLKSLQRQSQNETANICCYHLILYLGSSCFVASVFFLSYQNIPHGNFSLLKRKQLSGWAGGDKTRHLHDNIAVVIAYF